MKILFTLFYYFLTVIIRNGLTKLGIYAYLIIMCVGKGCLNLKVLGKCMT